MKALFVSDIHGSYFYAKKIKEIYDREMPDIIVLLGDLYYHGPRSELSMEYDPMKVAGVLNDLKEKLYVIKGNCDAEVDEMISNFTFYENLVLDINGNKVFCTHGHNYNIDNYPKQFFDIMAYGHLHTGFIKEVDSKLFVNPGSISLPKNGTTNSYLVIENKIELKDIDGNLIESRDFNE